MVQSWGSGQGQGLLTLLLLCSFVLGLGICWNLSRSGVHFGLGFHSNIFFPSLGSPYRYGLFLVTVFGLVTCHLTDLTGLCLAVLRLMPFLAVSPADLQHFLGSRLVLGSCLGAGVHLRRSDLS